MIYTLIYIAVLVFIGVFTLIAGIGGAPSVPSPKKAVKKMVSEMKIKPARIYYDLGAGDGRILKRISEKKAVAVGFEYTPLTYLLAKIMLKCKKYKHTKLYWKNFYNEDLKNANGVFCFLSVKAMEKLEEKFNKELKFGTKVISYAFPLPQKKPKKIIKNKGLAPIYVYQY